MVDDNVLLEDNDIMSSVGDGSPHCFQDDDPDSDHFVYNKLTGEYEEHVFSPEEEDLKAQDPEGMSSYLPSHYLKPKGGQPKTRSGSCALMPRVHPHL